MNPLEKFLFLWADKFSGVDRIIVGGVTTPMVVAPRLMTSGASYVNVDETTEFH